ncbi:CsbD family protein [Candidatus Leptofilum sp.]|uniref:CsbD family protein n=1 Tax=Candidatus Leptofilum sp. TaxID=3241576 RepID=UPI003B58DF91
MNEDILKGKWEQIKGQVRQKWGELTDDDVDRIAGKRQELVGVIQERYGRAQEEAEKEVDEFLTAYTE